LDLPLDDQPSISCYQGECSVNIEGNPPISLAAGEQARVDLQALLVASAAPIPIEEVQAFATSLPAGSSAFLCAEQFKSTSTPQPQTTRTPTVKPTRYVPKTTNTPKPPKPYGGAFTWEELDRNNHSKSSNLIVTTWGLIVLLIGLLKILDNLCTESFATALSQFWHIFSAERIGEKSEKLSQSKIIPEKGGD